MYFCDNNQVDGSLFWRVFCITYLYTSSGDSTSNHREKQTMPLTAAFVCWTLGNWENWKVARQINKVSNLGNQFYF